MSWQEWAIDAGLSRGEALCYVPIERAGEPAEKLVLGMNMINDPDNPPGRVVAIIHLDGNAAVQKWCDDNPAILARVKAANEKREARK